MTLHFTPARRFLSKLFLLWLLSMPLSLMAQEKIGTTAVDRSKAPYLSGSFKKFSLFSINTSELSRKTNRGKKASVEIELSLPGTSPLTLSLGETNILADDYRLIVATPSGNQQSGKPSLKTYSGRVGNDAASRVHLTISDRLIMGSIKTNGKELVIEPLQYFSKTADAGTFVLYEEEDVVPIEGVTCAVTEVAKRLPQLSTAEANRDAFGICKMVELAIAADDSMVLRYGTPALVAERNIAINNLLIGMYSQAQIGDKFLQFRINGQYISTSNETNPLYENYQDRDAGELLTRFTNWGEAGRFGFGYDIGQLWTTRNISWLGGSGTIGLATMAGACSAGKYQLLEDFHTSALSKAVLAAHETGHNLSADHDLFAGWVMSPSLTNPPALEFSPESLNQMSIFLSGGGAACINNCNSSQLSINISASAEAVCLGTPVTFTDQSVGQAFQRLWKFGEAANPATSNAKSQTVTWSTAGNKTISLESAYLTTLAVARKSVLVSAAPGSACKTLSGPSTGTPAFSFLQLAGTEVFSGWTGYRESDLTCSSIIQLYPGKTYPVRSVVGWNGGNATRLQLFIDYNNDGDFQDENESVYTAPDFSSGLLEFTITTPNTVPVINQFLRMRIIASGEGSALSDGCTVPGNGQRIDFSVYFKEEACPKLFYRDADNDGYGNPAISISTCEPTPGYVSQGGDCNDNNRFINPATIWVQDKDRDFYFVTGPTGCQSPGAGWSPMTPELPMGDCDDNDFNVFPGRAESCDGKDNDCDGLIDEDARLYEDVDKDGFGNAAKIILGDCDNVPEGYSKVGGDCNDNDPAIHPNTIWIIDADADGYYVGTERKQCSSPGSGYIIKTDQQSGDCNDNDATVHVQIAYYRDSDDDGFGAGPAETLCVGTAPEGYTTVAGDCNDADDTIYPGATELCDGKDNDCDGETDEGILLSFYKDNDLDGYGNAAVSVKACSQPTGYVANNTDCNDYNAAVNPGAVEACSNGIDDDCDGQVDEGCAGLPGIFISPTLIVEGNSGKRQAGFILLLNKKSSKAITVKYETVAGTATAGQDYVTANGTITFPANSVSQILKVDVNGDVLNEANETFSVKISNPVNGNLINTTGVCFIVNDDPLPVASVTDVSVREDQSPAKVRINLSTASGQTVKVKYSTANGTAGAPTDYTAQSNVWVTFAPGTTNMFVNIPVVHDNVNETTEYFKVKIVDADNAVVSGSGKQGKVTIINVRPGAGTMTNKSTSTPVKTATAATTPQSEILTSEKLVDKQVHFDVQVLPNPSTSEFVLNISSSRTGAVTVKIFDLQGRQIQVLNKIRPNGTARIGQEWKPGLYLAEILQDGERKIIKLLKN